MESRLATFQPRPQQSEHHVDLLLEVILGRFICLHVGLRIDKGFLQLVKRAVSVSQCRPTETGESVHLSNEDMNDRGWFSGAEAGFEKYCPSVFAPTWLPVKSFLPRSDQKYCVNQTPSLVIFVSVAPKGKHVMIHRAQSRYAHFHHLTLFRAASVSLFPRLSLVQALPSLSPTLLRSVTFRSQGMLYL